MTDRQAREGAAGGSPPEPAAPQAWTLLARLVLTVNRRLDRELQARHGLLRSDYDVLAAGGSRA